MENYAVPDEYNWKIKVSSFDVGLDRRLKLSCQLKLQQEVGELQLDTGGLGYEKLYSLGLIFVLTHLNTVIYRAPVFGEDIRLLTWNRGARGAQYYRCYRFLDGADQTLIDSMTAFALVDAATHKLLRPSEFNRFGVKEFADRPTTCPVPGHLKLPGKLQPAGERTIRWSDIDYNGHLNNSVYADIACDALPGGMRHKRITGMSVSFVHEALEGDRMRLESAAMPSDHGFEGWISGHLGEQRCFSACIRYIEE